MEAAALGSWDGTERSKEGDSAIEGSGEGPAQCESGDVGTRSSILQEPAVAKSCAEELYSDTA